jgi:hypothetical protein
MNFNIVFSALVSIALLSGGTSVSIASQPNLSEQQIGIINTCTDTWKICVGAIAGLVGGRNFSSGKQEEGESGDR